MKSTARLATIGFALILLSGCGSGAVATTARQSTPASQPSTPAVTAPANVATPQASQAASPKVLPTLRPPVPEELQYRWIGPLRDVPQITPKGDFTGLEIGARTAWFYPYTQGDGPDLRSEAWRQGTNELTFVNVAEAAGCHPNDTGTYTYRLDDSKTRLTVAAGSDPCQARVAAFTGDWTRADCPDPRGWCLGALAAGQHMSAVFTPFTKVTSWKYDYGEMSYSVPDGWSNTEDAPGGYALAPPNAPEFTAIYLFADVLAHLQTTDCQELPDMTVGSSASDLTEWLTNLPSIATTRAQPVTIGGLSGSTIDVSIDPAWTQTCSFSEGQPAASLFSNDDPRHEFDWGLSGDGRMRLFLLSLPNDRTLLIDIESTSKQAWDALLPAAMPIVESFAFSQQPFAPRSI